MSDEAKHSRRPNDYVTSGGGTRSTSQESLRSGEIAELRHRDASQQERRHVVARGAPIQCTDVIADRQGAPRW